MPGLTRRSQILKVQFLPGAERQQLRKCLEELLFCGKKHCHNLFLFAAVIPIPLNINCLIVALCTIYFIP